MVVRKADAQDRVRAVFDRYQVAVVPTAFPAGGVSHVWISWDHDAHAARLHVKDSDALPDALAAVADLGDVDEVQTGPSLEPGHTEVTVVFTREHGE